MTYTSPPNKKPVQNLAQCAWCKKMALLQDFSSSDGEKRVSCKDLCSALCFEKAVSNIRKNETEETDANKQLNLSNPDSDKPSKSRAIYIYIVCFIINVCAWSAIAGLKRLRVSL